MATGHLNGAKAKLRGRHTTYIEAAGPMIRALQKLDTVTGISLGFIDSRAGSKKARVRVRHVPAGLEVCAYGLRCMQVIHIYTRHHALVERVITDLFSS